MNTKTVTITSATLIVCAFVFVGLIANHRNATQGADVIGNAVASSIDNSAENEEWSDIEWQVLNDTVVSFWVNQQRIWANKHSVLEHGNDANLAAQCYNDHGAFMALANKNGDWYLPCREEDGTVRLTVWKRESPTSNRFYMQSAYTPKDGNWTRILDWLRTFHRAGKATFPQDTIFIIDDVIP